VDTDAAPTEGYKAGGRRFSCMFRLTMALLKTPTHVADGSVSDR
jgi:hypothetical protein